MSQIIDEVTMAALDLSIEVLSIVADDGRIGNFDVSPYLGYEAFEALQNYNEFLKVSNGGYFLFRFAFGRFLTVPPLTPLVRLCQ